MCSLQRLPTLSYTQRLENQVEELRAALARAQHGSVSPSVPNSAEAPASVTEESENVLSPGSHAEALSMTKSERLSLHGTTSLFRLPCNTVASPVASDQAERDMISNRESLLNSAWRERAFEKLADIPVSILLLFSSQYKLTST